MIARLVGTSILVFGLAYGMARPAGLVVDSSGCGAHVDGNESRASQANDPSQRALTQGAGTTDAKQSPQAVDQTQRARELIYYFRNYRVFCRDEEWAQTIRELATIGKAAIPELVAELDRTDRDATLRSLAFSLRAIDDPRAVPALIRAIPKALRPAGSDCGVNIADPDLRAFMLAHQNYKGDKETYVAVGRPVNEIIPALERITKHREPPDVGEHDPLRHVFLGGTPDQQAQQQALFEQRQKRWQAWWSAHWREFVTQEELHSVELPKRERDLVELAGVARYGALFPTGARVRLGPVRRLRLTQSIYANGKSHLDFDTGRVFAQYEGMKTTDWGQSDEFGSRISRWYRQNGIDVRCQGSIEGVDLQLWLIDDGRWDTLEAEIQKDQALELGREATSYLARFEKTRTDFRYDELATFLFTTRGGGRGIVQVFPKDEDADRIRLRYRMWLTEEARPTNLAPVGEAAAVPRSAKSPGTPFAKTITTTLELPAEGREFLLDLETGRKAVPPKFLSPDEIANATSLPRNEQFSRWCRDQGIDVFGYVDPAETEVAGAAAPVRKFARSDSLFGLIGLDTIEARILPETFEELTVEDTREILARMPESKPRAAWMTVSFELAERPTTYAFKTREGTVVLLQIEAAENEAGKLRIRYRLAHRD
jgi:hypothetical protein